jgi:hypothetical protein
MPTHGLTANLRQVSRGSSAEALEPLLPVGGEQLPTATLVAPHGLCSLRAMLADGASRLTA